MSMLLIVCENYICNAKATENGAYESDADSIEWTSGPNKEQEKAIEQSVLDEKDTYYYYENEENKKIFGIKKIKLSAGRSSFTAKWKKAGKSRRKEFSGYQIQYSTSKSFRKNAKIKSTDKKTASKVVIRKLKRKAKYYVRMRRYKKSGGKIVYSEWTNVKTVRTK